MPPIVEASFQHGTATVTLGYLLIERFSSFLIFFLFSKSETKSSIWKYIERNKNGYMSAERKDSIIGYFFLVVVASVDDEVTTFTLAGKRASSSSMVLKPAYNLSSTISAGRASSIL